MLEALTSIVDFFGFIVQFFQFIFNVITSFFTMIIFMFQFIGTLYAYIPAWAYPFFLAGIGISVSLLILGRN